MSARTQSLEGSSLLPPPGTVPNRAWLYGECGCSPADAVLQSLCTTGSGARVLAGWPGPTTRGFATPSSGLVHRRWCVMQVRAWE